MSQEEGGGNQPKKPKTPIKMSKRYKKHLRGIKRNYYKDDRYFTTDSELDQATLQNRTPNRYTRNFGELPATSEDEARREEEAKSKRLR